MRVLLVNPPDASQGGVSNPVLGLLYLASYIRDLVEVEYIDGFLEGWDGYKKKLELFKPNIVGVTMLTKDRHKSLQALHMAKDTGAITVTGGAHASAMAEQIAANYPYVDYIIQGEGEHALKELLKDIIQGYEDMPKIIQGNNLPLDEIGHPAWDMGYLDTDRYIGNADIRVPIIASRGCSGSCAFCSTWRFWRKYRARHPEDIADEIEMIVRDYGKSHFVFEDDSLSCDITAAKDTMRAIIKRHLDIRFFSTMRADGIDDELAALIKEAGGYGVSIGFESGSQRILDIMHKHITVEQNIKAALTVKQAGLSLCALMVYNTVGERDEDRLANHQFLTLIKADDLGTLGCLWILPDTHFYHQMVEHKFLNDSYWLGAEPVYVYNKEIDFLYP